MSDAISTARYAAAEEAFQNCEFIDGCSPVETNGWETDGNQELTRVLFIPNNADLDGQSLKGHFTVSFAPNSAGIESSWAAVDGNDIARPPFEQNFGPKW